MSKFRKLHNNPKLPKQRHPQKGRASLHTDRRNGFAPLECGY